MEQPTLFYAVVAVAAIAGAGDGTNVMLAWAYVVLRVVHSLVQATTNIIKARFAVFMAASLILLVLAVRVTMAVA